MGKLAQKTIVITGGSSGIGLASAKRFVAEGAFVYILGRRQSALDAAAVEIGSNVEPVQGDVSKLEDLDRLYSMVEAERGSIDALFANAGIGNIAALGKITPEAYSEVFDTNVKGTLFTVQKSLPLLKSGSSVILTGSTTGTMGTASFSIYSASKAAIRNFARSWALDLKGTGVRVNVLSPGATETPGLMNGLARTGMEDQMFAGLISQIPLGRLASPEEIAAVAAFLASDESSFINGSEIFADGGQAQI